MFIEEDVATEIIERLDFLGIAVKALEVENRGLIAIADRAEKTQAALLDALTREREARQ